jgi:hypothetical protein
MIQGKLLKEKDDVPNLSRLKQHRVFLLEHCQKKSTGINKIQDVKDYVISS